MKKFMALRAKLRKKLEKRELVIAPGAYDALTARVFEKAGYEAVYVTGHGVGAGMLGWTDVGLTTMTEMVWAIRNICNAVNLPVIADMDTGYGNVVNVMRAVKEYEQAGVAAFQIEDQTLPKKCGFMKGKALVAKEEMVGKIKAAIEAREDPNLLIIARCDARAIEGPEGLYQRLRAYAKAGADLLYPEAPCSAKDIREDAEHLKGFPLYLIGSWLSPRYGLTFQDIADMGYSVMILSTLAFAIAPKAVYDVAMEVRRLGTYPDFVKEGKEFSWDELQELIRLPEVRRIEQKFLPSDERKRRWRSERLPKEYYIKGIP
jgi:2-methylisocitrate lyase-like PEP mutase family enzyme